MNGSSAKQYPVAMIGLRVAWETMTGVTGDLKTNGLNVGVDWAPDLDNYFNVNADEDVKG